LAWKGGTAKSKDSSLILLLSPFSLAIHIVSTAVFILCYSRRNRNFTSAHTQVIGSRNIEIFFPSLKERDL
jgi:hypothetical protein